ncbi:MAG: lipolytic protein family [Chitinophagaceae bacterium]|nr:lipolytic protein family [Chitinophagaceae bacterium]
MKKGYVCFIILFFTYSMTAMSQPSSIKYLALGDSYTIGESVAQQQTFPFLLSKGLTEKKISIDQPQVIARTGWTTDELMSAMDKVNPSDDFDVVTLLIGVNNQFRGYPIAAYEKQFAQLVDRAIVLAKSKKGRVIVLSIPDYGCTPFGAGSKAKIGKEIDAFNEVNKRIAFKKGVHYVDITPISREASSHPALVAEDRLHPSGLMYKQWTELLLPEVEKALSVD